MKLVIERIVIYRINILVYYCLKIILQPQEKNLLCREYNNIYTVWVCFFVHRRDRSAVNGNGK